MLRMSVRSCAGVAAIFLTTALGLPTLASATPTSPAGGTATAALSTAADPCPACPHLIFQLKQKDPSGNLMCLDAVAQTIGNGDKVQLWKCNGQANQVWEGFTTATGFASYVNKASAIGNPMCLDAVAQTIGNGDKVQLWHCNDQKNQHWHADYPAAEWHVYLAQYPQFCLDAVAQTIGNGDKVQLWTCHIGFNNQAWLIRPAG